MARKKKNQTQKKELAKMIYQIGFLVSQDHNFREMMQKNKGLAEKMLEINKNLEETKKYHKVGGELGIKSEDISNSNIKLQAKLEEFINKENVDESVNLSGNQNDILEEN